MNSDPALPSPPTEESSAFHFSEHVRTLALELRDKARSTALEPEALVLANEVSTLCDFVARLYHELGSTPETPVDPAGPAIRSEQKQADAIAIQRGNHQVSQTALDVIKALFTWREPPGGMEKARGRDGADLTGERNRPVL